MKATLLFTLTLLLGFACFLTIGTAQTYVHHKTLLETNEGFKALAFSPDGTLLASGGWGGADNIYLHHPETGRLMHTLRGHTDTVNEVAFSPDGNLLASISNDNTVKLWNPQTGRLIRTLEGHQDSVYAVAFSPTGTLITGDRSGAMFRWTPAAPGEHRLVRRGTGDRVLTAAYSSTGDFAIGDGSGDRRFGIEVYAPGNDPQDPNRISAALHIDQQNWVTCVAFAATGELVSGSEDNTVSIFPPGSLRASKILRGHTHRVYWVAVSASGTIASASKDGTIRLWNLATGQHVATLDEHTDSVNTVAFSPNEKWLASGSTDGTVRLWQRSATGVTQVVQTPQTGGGGGTVQPTNNGWLATIVPTVGGQKVEDTTGNSPIAVNTNTKIPLTVSVTRHGKRVRTKAVLFSVEGRGPTLSESRANTTNGEVSVTLTLGPNEGTFKFIVKAEGEFVDDDPFTIGELSFTATEGPGADADSLKVDYPKTLEPRLGNGDGKFTLTFTVETPANKPKSNIAIDVDWMNGPQIEGIPTEWPRTNAQGVLKLPLRLKDSSTGTLKFRATVIGSRKELTQTHSITVKQTLAKVVLSSIPSKIDSGDSVSVTATAYSVNDTPARGVSITFSERVDTLRFDPTSGTTGSSGRVSTTLQTKGYISGEWKNVGSSNAYYEPKGSFSVSVSASHKGTTKSDSDSVAVVPVKKRGTDDFEVVSEEAGCSKRVFGRCIWWKAYSQRSWSDYASFPGTVLYIVDVDGEMSYGDRILGATAYIDGESIDGNTVDVWGTIKTHRVDPNNYFVTVKADYQAYAREFGGSPRAPSLHSQFNPETQQLSTFWQDLSQVPEKTALLPNYPNPFNPETWIPYRLAEAAEVTLTIYTVDGKGVRTLALGHQSAGFYQSRSRAAYWDGRNEVGERVASGVYFYTLTAGDFAATGKMLILK